MYREDIFRYLTHELAASSKVVEIAQILVQQNLDSL